MKKRIVWVLLGGVFLVAFLFLQGEAAVTAGTDYREELAQILKNQEKILQTLEEIKADLVKIRIRAN